MVAEDPKIARAADRVLSGFWNLIGICADTGICIRFDRQQGIQFAIVEPDQRQVEILSQQVLQFWLF